MSNPLLTSIDVLLSDIKTKASELIKSTKLEEINDEVVSNLSTEQVYSYSTALRSEMVKVGSETIKNWAIYLLQKYTGEIPSVSSVGLSCVMQNVKKNGITSIKINGETIKSKTTASMINPITISGVAVKTTVTALDSGVSKDTEYTLDTDVLFTNDTADIISGKVHRENGTIIFTGNEDTSIFSHFTQLSNGNYAATINPELYSAIRTITTIAADITCSHLNADAKDTLENSSTPKEGIAVDSDGEIILYQNSYTTAESLIAYFKASAAAKTPFTIIYKLQSLSDTVLATKSVTNDAGSLTVNSEGSATVTVDLYSTYDGDNDIIFSSELYNSLCNNISNLYIDYLTNKNGVDSDLNNGAQAMIDLLNLFNLRISVTIDQIKDAFENNRASLYNDLPLLKFNKITSTAYNTIKVSSPALTAAGGTLPTYNVPDKISEYYKFASKDSDYLARVGIQYGDNQNDEPPGVRLNTSDILVDENNDELVLLLPERTTNTTYSNHKVHLITFEEE